MASASVISSALFACHSGVQRLAFASTRVRVEYSQGHLPLVATMSQKSPYHTLKGLKEKSYLLWCYLNDVEEQFGMVFAEQYVRFKQATRSQFGDLRYKATWERAWASFTADHLWQNFDNSKFLIRTFTEFAPKEGWDHLTPLILDRLLQNERVFACIKDGFERIVQTSPKSEFPEERKLFHAIQEAIARQAADGRRSLATAA